MPYVVRNKDNQIVSISILETSTFIEFLSDDDPEVLEYLNRIIPLYKPYSNDEDDYIIRRRLEYPKTSDQLDLIVKTLKYLKNNGIVIGPDGETIVNLCEEVKTKIPKNWSREKLKNK